MTLRRQLLIVILVLFTLVFLGTFYISAKNIQSYLTHQMEIQAQNTASSLAVAISQHQNPDQMTMEVLIDSVFKTGHYALIKIDSLDNKVIVERRHITSTAEGAPGWFEALMPFELEPGSAFVSSGWQQIGKVLVYNDKSYAYLELWNNIKQTFGWFLLSAIITLILGFIALRYLLKPLDNVKRQADAICERDFSIQNKLPKTKELRSVVSAMNTVSNKVHTMFNEQTQVIDKLREQTYKEPVTGLGNRLYLNKQLEHFMHEAKTSPLGALFLIEFQGLDEYKQKEGYEANDLFIEHVASEIKNIILGKKNYTAYYINDETFALLAKNVTVDFAKKIAHNLYSKISDLHPFIEDRGVKFHIGVAPYQAGMDPSQMLAEADMAVRAAESEDAEEGWYIYNENELDQGSIHCASEWREFLEHIIETEDLLLHFQPVIKTEGQGDKLIQNEVLIRVHDDNHKLLNAGIFIPMAENLGMMPKIDKIVVKKTVGLLKGHADPDHPFAVDISPCSLIDKEFTAWLNNFMDNNRDVAPSIIFEVPEIALIHELEIVEDLMKKLGVYGCQFSVDHFGRGLESFSYLRHTKFNCIKIDGVYIRDIHENKDHQYFVQLVTNIAHNLDIKVVAENVEHPAAVNILKAMHVDGLQGYLVGKPSDKF